MTNLHLDRWSPALRRAVIAAQPEFFTWSPQQQDAWRLMLTPDDRTAIIRTLLAARADTAVYIGDERLPETVQDQINEQIQPLIGLGTDAFHLIEWLPQGTTILDFDTLLAYDQDNHAFQERVRAEDNPSHTPQPYYGALRSCWASALVDGRLVYLTLSMAASWLHDAICEAASEELDRRIPHRYVPGPDDGKQEAGGVRWDKRLDAGGNEALFRELRHRVHDYEYSRWQVLQLEWDTRKRRGTYEFFETWSPAKQHLRIVFPDRHVLGDVHFDSFMADCRRSQRSIDELHAAAAIEVARVRTFIAEQHDDIERNFDPRVTPLRPRPKILIAPGVLDGLVDDEE